MIVPCPAEWARQSVTWADWRPIPLPLPVDTWWGFGVVLVLLVLFVWMIVRLVSRETDDIDPAEVDRQMLTAINELHRQGDLSQEEFRSIKGQLVERLADRPASDSAGPVTRPARAAADETSDREQTDLDTDGVTMMPTGQRTAQSEAVPESESGIRGDQAVMNDPPGHSNHP